MSTTIEASLGRVQARSEAILGGTAKVSPGQPLAFTGAENDGDTLPQGDLYLVWREWDAAPEGYALREGGSVQLVPDNTVGAKHCLDSLDGVAVFDPPGYGPGYESLAGPVLVTEKEARISHPTHGPVTIPAGSVVECRYQANYDEQLKRERRALD